MTSAMIAYRVELADHLRTQKVIAENFFSAAAAAEETCEKATHMAINNSEQDAAQAEFKRQFRDAHRVRTEALNALEPPQAMPIGYESAASSHETHKFEPYRGEQELATASLERYL